MNDFDFLREHGYGVVYGEKNVRKLINQLGHTDPRKGNDMNVETTDTPVELTPTEAPALAPDAPASEVQFVQDEAFSEDEVR